MMLDRRQHGQSVVEFALIITVLLTMLLGMVDFALAYYSQVMIKNAVAEGGYYAIQHPGDTAGIEAAIDLELANRPFIQKVGHPTIVVCGSDVLGAKQTSIDVTYTHHLLFSYLVPSMQVTLTSQTVVPQLGCP
jgi:Flp pilus assembly protein TadG